MSHQWTDRLSEYLDDELPPGERSALEEHLRHCAACGAVLADLKRIVTRARGLEDQPPERDLWPGIAARKIDARVRGFEILPTAQFTSLARVHKARDKN